MQAQIDGALHGGLITGHTLSGTRTPDQDCCAPILRWTEGSMTRWEPVSHRAARGLVGSRAASTFRRINPGKSHSKAK